MEKKTKKRAQHFTIVVDEYDNWWMGEIKAGETAEQCRQRALREAKEMGFSPISGFERADEGELWSCETEGECGPGFAMACKIDERALRDLRYITFYVSPEGKVGRLLNTAFLKDASVKAREMLYQRGCNWVSEDCGEWEPRNSLELTEYPGTFGPCMDKTVWAKKKKDDPDEDADQWQFRGFII